MHDVQWPKLFSQFQNWDLESENEFIDELCSNDINARNVMQHQYEDSTRCANSFANVMTDALIKVLPRK